MVGVGLHSFRGVLSECEDCKPLTGRISFYEAWVGSVVGVGLHSFRGVLSECEDCKPLTGRISFYEAWVGLA